MDELDKNLLDILQADFPIKPRPFLGLARQLNCQEEQIIARIGKLKSLGIIRSLGPVFDAARLGYTSALVAAKVPLEKRADFVSQINSLASVSHNYGRKHEFNVWFTLTVRHKESIAATINQLRHQHGIASIYALPAVKTYKIRVQFDFGEPVSEPERTCPVHPDGVVDTEPVWGDDEIQLVRQLQEDMVITPEPFFPIAQRLAVSQECVLETINGWIKTGVIRRFGARIHHLKAGFGGNALAVFQINAHQLDQAGPLLAQYRHVSHCYQRAVVPSWPYNLYAMVHCRSEERLAELVHEMAEKIKPVRHACLVSETEYKKTQVKYFLD